MRWHAISKAVNRRSIAKREAALQSYWRSFPARSAAVMREVEAMIAEMRAHPPGPPRSVPLGEYEHPHTGQAMLDGMTHPGL
jgi:hypothetical protein